MRRLALTIGLLASITGSTASAQTLYSATGSNGINGSLYRINPATGAVLSTVGPLLVGSTGIGLTGMAFHPQSGVLYGVTTPNGNLPRSLVTVNLTTGAATLIGGGNTLGAAVPDISFNSAGVLYGLRGGSSTATLGTINLTTGAFTAIGSSNSSSGGNGLAFSTVSPFSLFAASLGDAGVLRVLNTSTGVATAGPTMPGLPAFANNEGTGNINAMAVDNAGTLFGVDSDTAGVATTYLISINTATGAITSRGQLPDDTDALAFQVAGPPGVPIPTTWLLMLAGLACLGLYQFRGRLFAQRG